MEGMKKGETEVKDQVKVWGLSDDQMELSFPENGKVGRKQAGRPMEAGVQFWTY